MNKNAMEILMENVIFLIIVLIFFAAMFVFVTRAGSQTTLNEQIYSKQIVLMIDKAKPGTEINLDISKLYEFAEKNSFDGKIITIDNQNNKVRVNLVQGKGYEFEFFNDVEIVWGLNDQEKLLSFEVIKNG